MKSIILYLSVVSASFVCAVDDSFNAFYYFEVDAIVINVSNTTDEKFVTPFRNVFPAQLQIDFDGKVLTFWDIRLEKRYGIGFSDGDIEILSGEDVTFKLPFSGLMTADRRAETIGLRRVEYGKSHLGHTSMQLRPPYWVTTRSVEESIAELPLTVVVTLFDEKFKLIEVKAKYQPKDTVLDHEQATEVERKSAKNGQPGKLNKTEVKRVF